MQENATYSYMENIKYLGINFIKDEQNFYIKNLKILLLTILLFKNRENISERINNDLNREIYLVHGLEHLISLGYTFSPN